MPGQNLTRQHKSKNGLGRKKPMRLIDNPEATHIFATIEKELGNCKFKVKTLEGLIYEATLSGNVKKSGRVYVGDTVLLQPLSEGGECVSYQIICRYTSDQRKMLEKQGKIVKFVEEEKENEDVGEEAFEFEDESKKRAEKDQLEIVNQLFDTKMLDDL